MAWSDWVQVNDSLAHGILATSAVDGSVKLWQVKIQRSGTSYKVTANVLQEICPPNRIPAYVLKFYNFSVYLYL